MTALIDDLGPRGICDFGVEGVVAGLEEQNVVSELLKFQGEGHTDGAGTDNAEINWRVCDRKLL